MVEKQASSEIAQSRERFLKSVGMIERLYRERVKQHGDLARLDNLLEEWFDQAERDTRERCAQMIEKAEKSRSMTTGMSYFMKELAGRIREHDRPETSHKCAEHIDEGPLESCNKCRCANVLNVEDRLPTWRKKDGSNG